MDSETSEDALDAIVGAALKGLVESGASRARIGAFAASFRDEVADILGRKPSTQPPDLLALVTEAVKAAIATPAAQPAPNARPAKPTAKRLYVIVNGQRTSLTMPADLLSRLDAMTGERKQTLTMVQQLAESVPPTIENRSRWVQQRARAALQPQDQMTPRH